MTDGYAYWRNGLNRWRGSSRPERSANVDLSTLAGVTEEWRYGRTG